MTNREWIESLTDRQLAEFYTHGLMVNFNTTEQHDIMNFPITIQQLTGSYMQSASGLEKWLSESQMYKVV